MEIGHFYYIEDQYFIDFPDVLAIEKKLKEQNNESTVK